MNNTKKVQGIDQSIINNSSELMMKTTLIEVLEKLAKEYPNLKEGKISTQQYISNVTVSGLEKGIVKGGKAIIAFSFQDFLIIISRHSKNIRFIRFAKSKGLAAALFGAIDQVLYYLDYVGGKIDERKYDLITYKNIGGTTAGFYGGIIGASLLSFIPGVGTMLGGMVGGYLGSKIGIDVGEQIFLFQESTD